MRICISPEGRTMKQSKNHYISITYKRIKTCIISSFALYYAQIAFFFFGLFAISWAALAAYGDSQARGRIGAAATGLHQSHSNSGSEPSATYTTAHGNARSLTH